MLFVVQNLRVRRIIPTSDNIMGSRRDNVMFVGNKTDLQVQSAVDKKIFYIPKYLLELYSSSKATARNSKNIVIEMDPPASLSVIITASSLISGYRSINGYVNFS